MEAFGIIGMVLGITGFIYGLLAFVHTARFQKRIEHLESELEKFKTE